MTNPNSSPLRQRPLTRVDLRARDAVETTILAYCYAKVIAKAQVTIRDLSTLPGPTGRDLGVSAALKAVRDLTDDGLLFLPGLGSAGLDQGITVLAPGQYPTAVKTNTGKVVMARKAPPAWTTGEKVFGLWLPKTMNPVLADEVRRAHLEQAAFNKLHQGKPCPVEEQCVLQLRKVTALRAWLNEEPHNKAVTEALGKAKIALDDFTRQRDFRKAKAQKA